MMSPRLGRSLIIFYLFPGFLMSMGTDNNSNLKTFDLFEKLPIDMHKEVLKHHIRSVMYTYIKHIKTSEEFTHMLYTSCKLLPECALTNHHILYLTQELIPIIFQEKEIQNLITKYKKSSIGEILHYAESKGLVLGAQLKGHADAYKEYSIAYNKLNGRPFKWFGKARDTSYFGIMKIPRVNKLVIDFLMGSYCEDQDQNSLNILRYAFEQEIYPSYSVFLEVQRIADACNYEELVKLLDEHKDKVLVQTSH